ncbi:MAG: hypothetical protein ACXWVX_09710 [Sulfuricurvum sp.]
MITAPLQVAFAYTEAIFQKILMAYLLLFIPFFIIGYILAQLSINQIRWEKSNCRS